MKIESKWKRYAVGHHLADFEGDGVELFDALMAEEDEGKLIEVPDSGGVSPIDGNAAFRKAEADYGSAWYKAISADIWGA